MRLLEAINGVQSQFIAHQDPQSAFELLVKEFEQLANCEFVVVGEVFEENDQQLIAITAFSDHLPAEILHTVYGTSSRDEPAPAPAQHDNMLGLMLSSGEPLISNDPEHHPRRSRLIDDISTPKFHNGMGIPLFASGHCVGFIALLNRENGFNHELLDAVASLTSVAGILLRSRQRARRSHEMQQATAHEKDLLSATLRSAFDGVVLTDSAGVVLEFNQAAERIFGYRRTEMIGQNVLDCLVPNLGLPASLRSEGQARTKRWKEFMLDQHWEIQAWRKDGTEFPCDIVISRVHSTAGTVFSAFFQDLTQRNKGIAELFQAKKDAESANRAKSAFMASISHEIRTPLNSISGTLSLLANERMNERDREMLRIARSCTSDLISIVNDLLDFSRIEAGKLTIAKAPIEPVYLVSEPIRVLALKAFGKNTNLSMFIDPRLPRTVTVDNGRIRQVLLNFLSNAIKYAPGELISVHMLRQTDHTMKFEVRDQGPGIAAEHQEKLFERFTQIDDKRGQPDDGIGLGLAISKGIVEQLGGNIGCESGPEQGSTFWFTIPLDADDGHVPQSGGSGEYHSLKVLLVGPHEPWQLDLIAQLRSWGVAVEQETDIESFLANAAVAIADFAPSLLFYCDTHSRETRQRIEAVSARAGLPHYVIRRLPIVSGAFGTPVRGGVLDRPVRTGDLQKILSLTIGATDPDSPEKPKMTLTERAMAVLKGRRVLYVEDSQSNQMVGTLMLERFGATADFVSTGLEAINAVSCLPYDLVFMDLNIPGMDGITAAEKIRKLPAPNGTVPIVALTADAFENTRKRCLAAGLNGVVTKPVVPVQMVSTLEAIFSRNEIIYADFNPVQHRAGYRSDREHIDLDAVCRLVDKTTEHLLPEMLSVFSDELQQRSRRIKYAQESENFEILEYESHALKSSAFTFGAERVRLLSHQLNDACKASDTKTATDVAGQLLAEIPVPVAMLKAILKDDPDGAMLVRRRRRVGP